mgnify:CR=1 FL=1
MQDNNREMPKIDEAKPEKPIFNYSIYSQPILNTFSVNTDTCVLCFGCINNCDYQAVNMEYDKEKVMGFNDFLEKNNLKFELPVELKT